MHITSELIELTVATWSLKSHGKVPAHISKRVVHVILYNAALLHAAREPGVQFTGSGQPAWEFTVLASLLEGCNFMPKLYKIFLYQQLQVCITYISINCICIVFVIKIRVCSFSVNPGVVLKMK